MIEFMLATRMIFRHPAEAKYIAPLYLREAPHDVVNIFLNQNKIPDRRFEFQGYIPKTVILQVFQEYAPMLFTSGGISNHYYWKNGLIIKDGNEQTVLVRFDIGNALGNAFIEVFNLEHSKGNSFLNDVIKYVKEIIKDYEVEEMVTLDGFDYVSLQILIDNAESGKLRFSERRKIEMGISNQDKPILNLKDFKKFTPAVKKKRVAISYAKDDITHINNLKRYLRPLVESGVIETPWCCSYEKVGTEWNDEIDVRFKEADIVFFMISDHFFESKYVIEKEVPLVIDRYYDNRSVKIVPIVLEYYDWKREGKYNLKKFNYLPYRGKPVIGYAHAKLVWYMIYLAIKHMIDKDIDPAVTNLDNREVEEFYEKQVLGVLDKIQ
jgi:hypothetical protein